jgi:hypothetical protein
MIRTLEWTQHAENRLEEWGLHPFEVEEAVRSEHPRRAENGGEGDWRIEASLPERPGLLVVIYDHPTAVDDGVARIVTLWLR